MKKVNLKFIFLMAILIMSFINVNALEKLGEITNFNLDENGIWSYDLVENATSYEILLYEEGGRYTGGNAGGTNLASFNFSEYTSYGKNYYIVVTASGTGYESTTTTSPLFESKVKKLIKPYDAYWDGKIAKIKNYETNEDYIKINLYQKKSSTEKVLITSKNLNKGETSYDFSDDLEEGKTYYFEAANIGEELTSSSFKESSLLKNNLPKLEIPVVKQIDGLGFITEKNSNAKNYTFLVYNENDTYTGLNFGTTNNYWLYSSDSLKNGLEDGKKYYVKAIAMGDDYNYDNSSEGISETFTYHKPTFYQNGNNYISVAGVQVNDINKDIIVEQIKKLGEKASGEVIYNPETNILTLNNFNVETEGTHYGTERHIIVFDGNDPVTISVKGNNNIKLLNYNGSAIYNWFGKIIFVGDGTLNVKAESGTAYRGNIKIDGPTINLESHYRGYDNGLSTGNIEMTSGEITFKSNNSSYEIIKSGTIISIPEEHCLLLGDDLDSLKYENVSGTFTTSNLSYRYNKYAKITKKENITKDKFEISTSLSYDKENKEDIIKPKNGISEEDYEIKYYKDSSLETEINEDEIIDAGTYYIKVTGKNYYTSSFVTSVEVKKQEVKIELDKNTFTYNGQVQKPNVIVKDKNGDILDNELYNITINENVNAGSYKVIVQFDKNYKNTETTYTINKKSISNISLSTIVYTYNGEIKTPTIIAKSGSEIIANKITKSNSNVTITYQTGRKNVGTYKITVKGKGNYTGTKTITFKINPLKTYIKSLTASRKAFTVKYNKKSTQTTGYQIQYSTSKSFASGVKTKTVSSYKTTSKKILSLKSKKRYYVRVRTYKTVGTTKYYSSWSTIKSIRTN